MLVFSLLAASSSLWMPAPPGAPPPDPPIVTHRPPVELFRVWEGIWNREPGTTLSLEGSEGAVIGLLDVKLGEHRMRSRVAGHYDAQTGKLRLRDVHGEGTYEAIVDEEGVLRGRFMSPGTEGSIRFAFTPASDPR